MKFFEYCSKFCFFHNLDQIVLKPKISNFDRKSNKKYPLSNRIITIRLEITINNYILLILNLKRILTCFNKNILFNQMGFNINY